MKRPAFQFYPADWRKDAALQSCSGAARGLWIELMCVMHECEPYGHLAINGQALTEAQAARMVGFTPVEYRRGLLELEAAGVFSRTDAGIIYCRRMVKDECLRNVRSQAGRLGGNPDLLKQKDNQPDNQDDKQTGKQKPTPSSSSSSSPSGLDCANSNEPVDNSAPNPSAINAEKQVKTATTPGDWWRSNEGIEAKARETGVTPKPGERYPELKARVFQAIGERERRAVA